MGESKSKKEEVTGTISIEEGIEKVEEILELMREGCPLEEAFEHYEKGMTILKDIYTKIDTVEKKVKLLSEEGLGEFDEPETLDFH